MFFSFRPWAKWGMYSCCFTYFFSPWKALKIPFNRNLFQSIGICIQYRYMMSSLSNTFSIFSAIVFVNSACIVKHPITVKNLRSKKFHQVRFHLYINNIPFSFVELSDDTIIKQQLWVWMLSGFGNFMFE